MTPEDLLRQRLGSARGLDDGASILLQLLNSGDVVAADGSLISLKQRIKQLGHLSIEINTRDHDPPHFHVCTPDYRVSFSIASCTLQRGALPGRDERMVAYWHSNGGKGVLTRAWEALRPTDVGRRK